MKKSFLFVLFILLVSWTLNGQNKTVRVQMNNGASLVGQAVEINPVSHIILSIAGLETRIEMKDIASIEADSTVEPQTKSNGLFAEDNNFPESITLQINDSKIEMVLVRGGDFMMGYDGKNSLLYKSEPLHPVRLNSFYVSRGPLTNEQLSLILGGKNGLAEAESHYLTRRWSQAKEIVEKLSTKTQLPICLITEAQWERLATSDLVKTLDWEKGEQDWCSDFYADYTYSDTPIINPAGPSVGKYHVFRTWDFSNNRFFLRQKDDNLTGGCAIRIVISATEYMSLQKTN